jgi:hypothetical protein
LKIHENQGVFCRFSLCSSDSTVLRQEPFDLSAEFTEDAPLLPMTPRSLGKFRVELPQQTEKKKVKVKARLTLHLGCTCWWKN